MRAAANVSPGTPGLRGTFADRLAWLEENDADYREVHFTPTDVAKLWALAIKLRVLESWVGISLEFKEHPDLPRKVDGAPEPSIRKGVFSDRRLLDDPEFCAALVRLLRPSGIINDCFYDDGVNPLMHAGFREAWKRAQRVEDGLKAQLLDWPARVAGELSHHPGSEPAIPKLRIEPLLSTHSPYAFWADWQKAEALLREHGFPKDWLKQNARPDALHMFARVLMYRKYHKVDTGLEPEPYGGTTAGPSLADGAREWLRTSVPAKLADDDEFVLALLRLTKECNLSPDEVRLVRPDGPIRRLSAHPRVRPLLSPSYARRCVDEALRAFAVSRAAQSSPKTHSSETAPSEGSSLDATPRIAALESLLGSESRLDATLVIRRALQRSAEGRLRPIPMGQLDEAAQLRLAHALAAQGHLGLTVVASALCTSGTDRPIAEALRTQGFSPDQVDEAMTLRRRLQALTPKRLGFALADVVGPGDPKFERLPLRLDVAELKPMCVESFRGLLEKYSAVRTADVLRVFVELSGLGPDELTAFKPEYVRGIVEHLLYPGGEPPGLRWEDKAEALMNGGLGMVFPTLSRTIGSDVARVRCSPPSELPNALGSLESTIAKYAKQERLEAEVLAFVAAAMLVPGLTPDATGTSAPFRIIPVGGLVPATRPGPSTRPGTALATRSDPRNLTSAFHFAFNLRIARDGATQGLSEVAAFTVKWLSRFLLSLRGAEVGASAAAPPPKRLAPIAKELCNTIDGLLDLEPSGFRGRVLGGSASTILRSDAESGLSQALSDLGNQLRDLNDTQLRDVLGQSAKRDLETLLQTAEELRAKPPTSDRARELAAQFRKLTEVFRQYKQAREQMERELRLAALRGVVERAKSRADTLIPVLYPNSDEPRAENAANAHAQLPPPQGS